MKKYLKIQLSIALRVYVGEIIVGYIVAWSASELVKLQDPDKSPLPSSISDNQAALVGALVYVGAIVGPFLTGYLSNVKGRKVCFILSGVFGILAFIMLAAARNLELLYASRTIMGISGGTCFVVGFVYIGEISSPSIRGILLFGVPLFSNVGILMVYSIGPYVSFGVISYIGLALSILFTGLSITLPETPLFYVLKSDIETAKQKLIELGREDEVDSLSQKKEDEVITSSLKDWTEIVTIKSNRKTFFITLTLNTLQQLSGIFVLTLFATNIFEITGSSIDPAIATIIIGAAQLFASIVSVFFVENAGRRMLLMCSSAFCALSLATLGTYFYFLEKGYDVQNVSWLPLVTLIVFSIAYCFGFAVVPQALVGEMFTPNVRTSGATVCITASFLFGFVVTATFNSMMEGIGGYGTFWLFSGACVVTFVFTAVFVPETKQKTLDEILEILSK